MRRVFREEYGGDLLRGFRKHRDAGKLEIITCGATHGFLPLMDTVPQAVRAQVQIARAALPQALRARPAGDLAARVRLPPGARAAPEGGRASATSSSSRTGSPTRTRGRATASTRRSLSPGGDRVLRPRHRVVRARCGARESGYPGDFDYREFYQDVGFELPTTSTSSRVPARTACARTWASSTTASPAAVGPRPQAAVRAGVGAREGRAARRQLHVESRRGRSSSLARAWRGRPLIVVSPYDAELFGHWWFEGPSSSNFLFRKMHYDQDVVKAITPSRVPGRALRSSRCAQPPMCTWGAQGLRRGVAQRVATTGSTRTWTMAAERMVELAHRYRAAHGAERRALNQAARELLLAQSSRLGLHHEDRHHGRVREEAHPRPHRPLRLPLPRALGRVPAEEPILREFEERDNIFPELDYRVYR